MCNISNQYGHEVNKKSIHTKFNDKESYLICIDMMKLSFLEKNNNISDEDILENLNHNLRKIYDLDKKIISTWIYDKGIIFIKITSSENINILDDINKIIKDKYISMHRIRVGYVSISELDINSTILSYISKMIKNFIYIVKDKVTQDFCLDKKIRLYKEVKNDLLNTRGEYIHLYYQPKLCLHDNNNKTCEVLCRWIHPNLGVYYPDEILPIINHLDENSLFNIIIFEKVCKEMKEVGNLVDSFSVNIALDDICKIEFAQKVCSISKEYNISPDKITFEIVENGELVDYYLASENINMMIDLGYKFSIDDFGNGYSSYFRLSSINFREVKIPKEFLAMYNSEYTNKSKSILNGIIEMCKRLGCSIVVEGVESSVEYKLCEILKVDYIQGYYVSRPLSIDNYIKYLKQNS